MIIYSRMSVFKLLFTPLVPWAAESGLNIQLQGVGVVSTVAVVLREEDGLALLANVNLVEVHVLDEVAVSNCFEVCLNILSTVVDVSSLSSAKALPSFSQAFSFASESLEQD